MGKIKDIKPHLKNREDHSHSDVDDSTIEDVVRSHVTFSSYDSSSWNKVYCAVCGDGSRTQGPRGGWKFDGENCAYNCFNCAISGMFTPQNEIFMSKDMKIIFEAFGIPKREYAKILFKFRDSRESKDLNKPDVMKTERIENMVGDGIIIPDYLVELEKAENTNIGRKAIEFLEGREIYYKDYPFFVTYGKTNSKIQQDKINCKILKNRLIIPIYYNNKLLLLQGRTLDAGVKNKYINIGNVSNTLYGLDRLKDEHEYVFVTEGFFDAYHLNGVACITNKLTSQQIKMLNQINKNKVIVPDRDDSTLTMLNKGIEQGWGYSAPKSLRSCKDVTEAIQRYGKLFTVHEIMTGVKLGEEAEFFAKSLGTI
jgi:hypothetical protein